MPTYITVSQGESGADAEPLFATADPGIVDVLLKAIERRIRDSRPIARDTPAGPVLLRGHRDPADEGRD